MGWYDVKWESNSIEADSPEEAARAALDDLRRQLTNLPTITLIVQEPDEHDDDLEITVSIAKAG